MYNNATKKTKYEKIKKKTSWKNQKRYDFPKPTWDPDIE